MQKNTNEATEDAKTEDTAKDTNTDTEALGDAGKRALDNERAARREAERKLAEAQAELQKIEDSKKSELELATERAARFEAQYNDLVAQSLRSEVALSKGLTTAQAKRLVGETREELEADADELITSFAVKADEHSQPKPGLLKASGDSPDPAITERAAIAQALFKL